MAFLQNNVNLNALIDHYGTTSNIGGRPASRITGYTFNSQNLYGSAFNSNFHNVRASEKVLRIVRMIR